MDLPIPKTDPAAPDWLQTILDLKGMDEAMLLTAWLIGCFMPRGPYPILVLQGEQGSGKSTLASMLRSLVDPAKADRLLCRLVKETSMCRPIITTYSHLTIRGLFGSGSRIGCAGWLPVGATQQGGSILIARKRSLI